MRSAVVHFAAKETKLWQDFVAAHCLPVHDSKGTAWKTRVAGWKRVDNTKLLQPLSFPPNQPQNALREHQLTHSGYSVLLCNALLRASTQYDHSCIILHAMRHLSVGSIRNQVSLGRRCWGWKTRQRTSLNGSRPCSRAWKAGLCIL